MKNVFTYILGVLALILFSGYESSAQISVDSVIVHLKAGERPVHNVIVGNSSNHTAYVIVEVKAMTDPAKDSSVTEPSTDLLASPKAFSIEPNGQRTVRLLLKTPPIDRERVFRVGFVPQDKGFGDEIEKEYEGRKMAIRVLSGIGILVFADPIKPEVKFTWERKGNKIVFTNSGSVQVYLGDGKSCNKGGLCTPIQSKRIYAGSTHEITADPDNVVSFLKQEGASGEYQKLTIEAKG